MSKAIYLNLLSNAMLVCSGHLLRLLQSPQKLRMIRKEFSLPFVGAAMRATRNRKDRELG